MTNDRLPRLTAAEAIKALKRAGFSLARQSGSHKLYKDKEGKRVTVPYRSGRILHPKVLKSILRDAELTVKELKDLLE